LGQDASFEKCSFEACRFDGDALLESCFDNCTLRDCLFGNAFNLSHPFVLDFGGGGGKIDLHRTEFHAYGKIVFVWAADRQHATQAP
jgi:hypothetical protein